MRKIYVLGVFDLFHVGHISLLIQAKNLGGELVVGINSDNVVKSYKRTPIIPEKERLEIVRNCKIVDKAFIVNTLDNKEIVTKNRITTIVHGDDWTGESYLNQICLDKEFVLKNKIELIYVPYFEGTSTSKIIEKIKMLK
jgi:glycerol-3-phosphate cytidylyltransferase